MELNYAGLAVKNTLEKHPEVFSLEGLDERIAATIARAQAEASINAAARAEKDVEGLELQREYNALRTKLFELQQECRGCENHVNEAAGKIVNLEKRINILKGLLALAVSPQGEKSYKHQIRLAEEELAEAKDAHHLACRYNRKAVKQLREFDQSKITELRKQIEAKRTFNDQHAKDMQADHDQRQLNAQNGVRS